MHSLGVVVTYDRNYVSNQLLRDKGIKVIEIKGSELVHVVVEAQDV